MAGVKYSLLILKVALHQEIIKNQRAVMKLNTYIFFLIFSLISIKVFSQDAALSQFYNAPTMFNAAEIGHRTSGGKYRFNGVHRNLGEGFRTTSLALDQTIDWSAKSYMGVGGAFIHDENANGAFQTMTLLGGFSIHMSLDKKEEHFLSVGTQFGFLNNQLRPEKLIFENDILGGEQEVFANRSLFNFDGRMGILYSYFPTEYQQLKIGFSVNHFVDFSDRFISDISTTNTQFSASVDYSQSLNDAKWIINPHALFLSQGTFSQVLVGVIGTRNCSNGIGFSFGASYKTADLSTFNTINSRDAVIAIVGFRLENGSRIYASHSFNISPLNDFNNATGNFELGIQWIINSANNKRIVSPDMLRN